MLIPIDVNIIDSRCGRTGPEVLDEALDLLLFTFNHCLDPPISYVPHPTGKTEGSRVSLSEISEIDPLDDTADKDVRS